MLYLAASEARKSVSEIETARRAHMQAVVKLENHVMMFERMMLLRRKSAKKEREPKPINWKKMIDGIAVAASALSKATDGKTAVVNTTQVIDMKAD